MGPNYYNLYIKAEAWEEALHVFGNKMFISIVLRLYSNEESEASSHQAKLSECGSASILRNHSQNKALQLFEQVEYFLYQVTLPSKTPLFPASANGWP